MPSHECLLFTDIFAEVSRRGLILCDIATALLTKLKNPESGLYAQGHARVTDYPYETDAERLEQRLAHQEAEQLRRMLDDDWVHPRRNLVSLRARWDDDQAYIPDPEEEPPLPGILDPAEKAPLPHEEREAVKARLLELSAITSPRDRSVERAPNSAKYPIPCFVWELFDTVDARGTSSWLDDEDEPEAFANVDWLMGTCEWDDSYPDEHNHTTIWQLSNLEIVGTGLRKAIFSRNANHDSSPDDKTLKQFMEQAVRNGLKQGAARRAWWDLYPGRGVRDGLDAVYRDAHVSINGILPRQGRPRKLPD